LHVTSKSTPKFHESCSNLMVTDWVYDAGKIGDKVNGVTHARN